jgi:quinol monooxygenase YgiN
MDIKQLLLTGTSMLTLSLCGPDLAQVTQAPYARMAELEVDSTKLDAFTAAVREVGDTSVQEEPGCLVLYAMAERENPSRVRVFEVYRDADAYGAHIQTPHFKKFRATTDTMVISRRLVDAIPISLAAKAK